MVEKITIQPSFTYPNGVWNLNLADIKLPEGFLKKEEKLLCIPAGAVGGNHSHPRTEIFIGVGENLLLVWEDAEGTRHKENMSDAGAQCMFIVHSLTPHAVVNNGTQAALLLEIADGPLVDAMDANLV